MACNSYFKNRQTKKELFADINMTAAMHIEKADCWFLFKGEVINAQEHIFGRFVFDIYVQMLVDIGFITRYKDDEPYFKINKKYRERWCIPTNMELAYPIEYMFGVRKKDLIRAN
jgi:hypothetical protein